MGGWWQAAMIDLFRPESTLGLSGGRCTPVPPAKRSDPPAWFSFKALFWIVISIATGLIIGRLC